MGKHSCKSGLKVGMLTISLVVEEAKIEVVNKCPSSAIINITNLPFTNCRYKFISFETLC